MEPQQPRMNIPGIKRMVEVPAPFEQHARRLGYAVEELVWLLAADVCARPPGRIKCITVPVTTDTPPNVLAFPTSKPPASPR